MKMICQKVTQSLIGPPVDRRRGQIDLDHTLILFIQVLARAGNDFDLQDHLFWKTRE